jgi:hypothetical protein
MSFWTNITTFFSKFTGTNKTTFNVNTLATNVNSLVLALEPIVAAVEVATKTDPETTDTLDNALAQVQIAAQALANATSQTQAQALLPAFETLINNLVKIVKAVPGIPPNVLSSLTIAEALLPIIEGFINASAA